MYSASCIEKWGDDTLSRGYAHTELSTETGLELGWEGFWNVHGSSFLRGREDCSYVIGSAMCVMSCDTARMASPALCVTLLRGTNMVIVVGYACNMSCTSYVEG